MSASLVKRRESRVGGHPPDLGIFLIWARAAWAGEQERRQGEEREAEEGQGGGAAQESVGGAACAPGHTTSEHRGRSSGPR